MKNKGNKTILDIFGKSLPILQFLSQNILSVDFVFASIQSFLPFYPGAIITLGRFKVFYEYSRCPEKRSLYYLIYKKEDVPYNLDHQYFPYNYIEYKIYRRK